MSDRLTENEEKEALEWMQRVDPKQKYILINNSENGWLIVFKHGDAITGWMTPWMFLAFIRRFKGRQYV